MCSVVKSHQNPYQSNSLGQLPVDKILLLFLKANDNLLTEMSS